MLIIDKENMREWELRAATFASSAQFVPRRRDQEQVGSNQ